jgi:hypothetical protein
MFIVFIYVRFFTLLNFFTIKNIGILICAIRAASSLIDKIGGLLCQKNMGKKRKNL